MKICANDTRAGAYGPSGENEMPGRYVLWKGRTHGRG